MARTFRSIQVLRAIAATAVVVDHADRARNLNGLADVGAAGVDLFFVISGFIMASILSDRTATRFLIGRARRIFPLWFIALTPWLLIRHNDSATLLTSLTLWPVWGAHFSMPALGVGWSLCFEMLFYVAFAISLATRAAIPLAIFALALILTPVTGSVVVGYVGSPIIFEFLAGVLIARLPVREGLGLPLLAIGLLWLFLAPTDYRSIVLGHAAYYRIAAWGVPAALIVYSALCLEGRFGKRFDIPVLLGDASYSIYLFHPLVALLEPAFLPAVALSLGVGVLIHLTIERRLMRFRLARQEPVTLPLC